MSSVASDSDEGSHSPQTIINEFWENLITKKPGRVTKVFPSSLYTNLLPQGSTTGKNAAESYEAAAKECRSRVQRIVRECERTNEKFTDPEFDMMWRPSNCLHGLLEWYEDPSPDSEAKDISSVDLGYALRTVLESDVLTADTAVLSLNNTANLLLNRSNNTVPGPGSVHRVDWIFEKPKFEIKDFASTDVVQGRNGDCWFIAAVATICSSQELIKRVCVARNERCGVYGFVFYRDGEWIPTVVDDNLFLTKDDFDAKGDIYDPTGIKERRYRKNKQTGSEALYFASCADENETWLPLLEKAYAKVHGDYDAISGGIPGEAVEDLTGGVTTKVLTNRILDKDRLWNELKETGKEFVFSAASPNGYGGARRGLALNHAYSIIKARNAESEDKKTVHRLVLVRNPWGRRQTEGIGEWNGPWSDGSKEWNQHWLKELEHEFGDDGMFWIAYEDLLKRFDLLDRTRIFDSEWTVVQSWTSVSVTWVTGYMNTKFSVEIKKAGPTVLQLCQLDDRYFRGLVGKYSFDLHFVLQVKDAAAGDYIIRARGAWFGHRSISAEVDLEPGIYEVVPKIEARRDSDVPDIHEVVTKVAERNPQKLRQIGMNYDLANARGLVEPSEAEKKQEDDKRKKAAERKREQKEVADKEKVEFEAWKKDKEEYEAWKRERKRSKETTKVNPVDSSPTEIQDTSAGAKTDIGDTSAGSAAKLDDNATAQDSRLGADEEKSTNETPQIKRPGETSEPQIGGAGTSGSDVRTACMPYEDRGILDLRGRRLSRHTYDDTPRIYHGDEPAPLIAMRASSPAGKKPKIWNAVCVLGLRVYSQDSEVNIKLVKPKSVEEGAILDVGGETAAGATM